MVDLMSISFTLTKVSTQEKAFIVEKISTGATLKRILKSKFFTVGIYLLKVYKRSTRAKCEICSKLTTKAPEQPQWQLSGVIIVNFEHFSHLFLVFLLVALNMQLRTSKSRFLGF